MDLLILLIFFMAFFALIGWLCRLSKDDATERRDRIVELAKIMAQSHREPEPMWKIPMPTTKRRRKVRRKKQAEVQND